MNFNLVEMYNGLLRFNKHILNELAEGLKHLPNLDGVSKGDSLIINEQGNPAWGSAAFIPTFENAARVLLLGGDANHGSGAGSGCFDSDWVRSDSSAHVGFFTTVKLD
jgi:hypothetical protein